MFMCFLTIRIGVGLIEARWFRPAHPTISEQGILGSVFS